MARNPSSRLAIAFLCLVTLAEPTRIILPALPALAAAALLAPAPAAARARGGYGYSRPSIAPSPAPSFGGRSSGGYFRPPIGAGENRRPSIGVPSPGDRAIARQNAEEALRRYRAQGERQATPGASGAPSSGGGFGPLRPPRGSSAGIAAGRDAWFASRGWRPPAFAYGAPASYGIWNGLFLWFLLDTLSRPGHAQFFYDHQNDPGYQAWHQQAERLAQNDPALRQKLDGLDQQLQARQGQPVNPAQLPPGVPPEVAVAAGAVGSGASPGSAIGVAVVVIVGGGILFLLWLARRRLTRPISASSKAASTQSPFRLGMTITMDPTPFVLAAEATKVPVPKPTGATLLASVFRIGVLHDGVRLDRLYLDERSFFQLHLGEGGEPDECRFFGIIDEVTPAGPDEWAFWLDPAEGLIGWPSFQTKDGKIYPRLWSPGTQRIAPQGFTETLQSLEGTGTRRIEAMLYAAPTDRPPPAPATEYILVAMIEAGASASIEIAAGIDVNPAALSLT